MTELNPEQLLLHETDRCVMCGMCLPHCPTYALTGDEAESPRGRISLIQGLARGALAPEGRALEHLDHCLLCRACEAMCPSGVNYGRLMVSARRRFGGESAPTTAGKALEALTEGHFPRRLARAYQKTGLQTLTRATGLLKPLGLSLLDELLPPLEPTRRLPEFIPAVGKERGQVTLFTGCTAGLEQGTLKAAVRVLTCWGFSVRVPREQTCCGALHQHAGQRQRFEAFARQNLAAFAEPQEPVLFVSSGCGALLTAYDEWLAEPAAAEFSARAREITDFLAELKTPPESGFTPLDRPVVVQTPCSQRNVLRAADAPFRLLRHIPGLEPRRLPEDKLCCGAAGRYMLDYPETADRLRARQLEGIQQSGAGYVVTTNPGCLLHLAAGARSRGLTVEFMHPVELLARQLQ